MCVCVVTFFLHTSDPSPWVSEMGGWISIRNIFYCVRRVFIQGGFGRDARRRYNIQKGGGEKRGRLQKMLSRDKNLEGEEIGNS